MKKLLLPLCFVFALTLLLSTGCKKNDWIEVQSITYTVGDETHTLTSTYEIDYDRQPITQEEFCAFHNITPDQLDNISATFESNGVIPKNRHDCILNLEESKGETYFCKNDDYYNKTFYKITSKNYTLNYVKIKFKDNNNFELNYNNETTLIFSSSYEITYFEN